MPNWPGSWPIIPDLGGQKQDALGKRLAGLAESAISRLREWTRKVPSVSFFTFYVHSAMYEAHTHPNTHTLNKCIHLHNKPFKTNE